MKTPFFRNYIKPQAACLFLFAWLVLAKSNLHAHHPSGAALSAPTKPAGTIVLNGMIDIAASESVWSPGQAGGNLPNDCAEFTGGTAPAVTFYALNDATNLYMAFDIPDASANANDALFLFFDPNHGGDPTIQPGDQAFHFIFNNTSASDEVPGGNHYVVTAAGTWPAPAALPAGVAKYTRHPGRWQIELRFPFTGPTVGFVFLYCNETGAAATDCDVPPDFIIDDFYVAFPSALTFIKSDPILNQASNPSLWGNLNFGPPPPTVTFQPPLCCNSADIITIPATLPFTAGTNVDLYARVHNLDAATAAQNVNVQLRVHKFGTGGGIIFSDNKLIPSIPPLGNALNSVTATWAIPSTETGLHGCIRAEILPPTISLYFIASGNATAQKNIEVACIPQGQFKRLQFMAFNPDRFEALEIKLVQQALLPPGFEGLKLELEQPQKRLQPQEEVPVRLTVIAPANLPLTQLPGEKAHVLPTSGGTASPPLRRPSGTEPILVQVRPNERLHITASGEVDLDGKGRLPSAGPDGKDFSKADLPDLRFLLASKAAIQFAGALIGSFDAFRSSFVIGSEITLTVPERTEKLWLAVNDQDTSFNDNTGKGFDVVIARLPDFTVVAPMAETAQKALPQVDIAAASTAKVTAGNAVYDLLTYHGAVTYQFLIIEGERRGPVCPCGQAGAASYALSSALVLVGLVFIRRRFHRNDKKQRAMG
jgi:hypothetical protein